MKKLISYLFFLVVEMIIPTSIASYTSDFTGKLQILKKGYFGTNTPQKERVKRKKLGFTYARKK